MNDKVIAATPTAAVPLPGDDQSAHAAARIVTLLLLIVGVFQLGGGVVNAVVPIRLAQGGLPPSVIGWVTSTFSIGFLAGCIAAAPLINALGAGRAILVLASANAATTLLLLATSTTLAWAIARGLAGFAMASLLVLIEAWLATAATTANRARVFGIYMVLSRLAFALGQAALTVVDPASSLLLLAAVVAYLASPWPALAMPGAAPVIGAKSGPSLTDLPVSAPAAAAAALVHGLIGTAGPALLPLYALARGLTVDQVALLLAAIPLGGLLFQIPFSHLSDRYGRRTMMAMSALATAALSLVYLLPTLPGFGWIMLLTTLWGGAPAALYLLAVAHANDIATDAQRIGWSSTLLLLWGIGAAVGPLAASLLMERFGYDMLFVSAAGLSCGLALFLGLRKLIRKRGDRREPAGNIIGPAPGASGS